MASLDYKVSQEDLQQLSAMLDGEISDETLDTLLARMAQEPALGAAWTRLSQIQAASHRHVQAGFELDLSAKIAQKLRASEPETVPTPVVQLHKEKSSKQVLPRALAQSFLQEQCAQEASTTSQNQVLDLSPYKGVERRRETQKFSKRKSFKQQMLAHLAVAASVASITVWVQNSLIQTPQMAEVVPLSETLVVEPTTGVVPASLRIDQTLPMATVGNGVIENQSSSSEFDATNSVTESSDTSLRVKSLGGAVVHDASVDVATP